MNYREFPKLELFRFCSDGITPMLILLFLCESTKALIRFVHLIKITLINVINTVFFKNYKERMIVY